MGSRETVDAFSGIGPGQQAYEENALPHCQLLRLSNLIRTLPGESSDEDQLNDGYDVEDGEKKVVKDADCPEIITNLSRATIGRPSKVDRCGVQELSAKLQ